MRDTRAAVFPGKRGPVGPTLEVRGLVMFFDGGMVDSSLKGNRQLRAYSSGTLVLRLFSNARV